MPSQEGTQPQQIFPRGEEAAPHGDETTLSLHDKDDIMEEESEISMDDYEVELNMPMLEVERFLDEDIAREQGNSQHSSSRVTGFEMEVEGKYKYFFNKCNI